MNKGITRKIRGFMQQKMKKKIIQSPLLIILKGKIKITHLLPERSEHQEGHFLAA